MKRSNFLKSLLGLPAIGLITQEISAKPSVSPGKLLYTGTEKEMCLQYLEDITLNGRVPFNYLMFLDYDKWKIIHCNITKVDGFFNMTVLEGLPIRLFSKQKPDKGICMNDKESCIWVNRIAWEQGLEVLSQPEYTHLGIEGQLYMHMTYMEKEKYMYEKNKESNVL